MKLLYLNSQQVFSWSRNEDSVRIPHPQAQRYPPIYYRQPGCHTGATPGQGIFCHSIYISIVVIK